MQIRLARCGHHAAQQVAIGGWLRDHTVGLSSKVAVIVVREAGSELTVAHGRMLLLLHIHLLLSSRLLLIDMENLV